MKFEHKDILILGDSFCTMRHSSNDWPFIISQTLSGSHERTLGRGYGGASWWSVRKKLLEELELNVPKILIVCHTNPTRIPNDYDVGLNWATVETNVISLFGIRISLNEYKQKRIIKATRLYYEELCSGDYCTWAMIQWFNELDDLAEVYKIPYVIHLSCFDNCPNYVFKNGITIKERLWTLANFDNNTYDDTGYHNHFTEEMNKKVGNRLVELVLNYQPGLQELAL